MKKVTLDKNFFKNVGRILTTWMVLNLPFWILGFFFGFTNFPIFNVDLLIPIVLSTFSGAISIAIVFIIWIIEWAIANSAQFYFKSSAEFLLSARYLQTLSLKEYFSPTSLIACVLFFTSIVIFFKVKAIRTRHFKESLVISFSLCTIVTLVDLGNGSSEIRGSKDTMMFPINVAGSPLLILIRNSLNEELTKIRKINDPVVTQFPHHVLSWAENHPNRSVVYIVVESWGINNDDRINDRMRDLLMDGLSATYSFSKSRTPFSGATTSGELRELCALTGSYRKISAINSAKCLPRAFSDMGWNTTGIHGFSKSMFLRSEWWPEIGLTNAIFREELSTSSDKKCGGIFPGMCDDKIIETAFTLAATPKQFVYALTLNSHLPLVQTSLTGKEKGFCASLSLAPAICLLNEKLAIVFSSINDSLLKVAPSKRPLVVIVGDHAPPFSEKKLRQQYSQREVPKFMLTPKD